MTHFLKLGGLVLLGVMITMLVIQCNSSPKDSDKTTSEKFEEERIALRDDLKELQQDIDRELDKLGNKIDNASDESKARMEDTREELRQQKVRVQKSLNDVENSTADTWGDIRREARKTGREVRQGFKELGQKFKEMVDDIKD